MTMFDNGQAADLSLSDEALFGDETPEVESEGQEGEQPQAEATEEGPAEPDGEQTSPEPEAEAATPEEPAQEPEQSQSQLEALERQAREATARMTRACQDAAELRRQNERLQQQLAETQRPQLKPPENPEEFMQSFMQNPQAVLANIAQEQARRMAGEQVKQVLQPVLQTLEQKTRAEAWDRAWQEIAPNWVQLQNPQEQQQLMQRMEQISADLGDAELWQKQPARLLQMAAVELYGLPKTANSEVVQAASEAGRKAAMAEMQAKNSAKTGLAAAKGTHKKTEPDLSPEEKIVKDIAAVMGGKLF